MHGRRQVVGDIFVLDEPSQDHGEVAFASLADIARHDLDVGVTVQTLVFMEEAQWMANFMGDVTRLFIRWRQLQIYTMLYFTWIT